MANSYGMWLIQYMKRVNEFHRDSKSHILKWSKTSPEDERVRYVKAIQSSNWEKLVKVAKSEIKARHNTLAEIRRYQAKLKKLLIDLPHAVSASKKIPIPSKQSDYQERKKEIKKALKADGIDAKTIKKSLKYLDNINLTTSISDLKKVLKSSVIRIDKIVEDQQASLMGAILALTVARFNQQSINIPNTKTNSNIYYKQTTKLLSKNVHNLFLALKKNDAFAIRMETFNLRKKSTELLFGGTIPHLINANVDAGGNFGKEAIQFSSLLRYELYCIALALQAEWILGWPENWGKRKQWAKSVKNLSSSKQAFSWPKKIPISKILAKSNEFDGQFLRIEGIVSEINILHNHGKAISIMKVKDGNKYIEVVLPYIKIDSGGIVAGSSCKIAGYWRKNVKEINRKGLELDRISLTTLAKNSWYEQSLLFINEIYTPVPHSLTVEWTWRAGKEGAANQLHYGTWHESRR